MNYTKEAKVVTQSLYGGYCSMKRELKEEITPYHSFTIEEYEELKLRYKNFKNDTKRKTN